MLLQGTLHKLEFSIIGIYIRLISKLKFVLKFENKKEFDSINKT